MTAADIFFARFHRLGKRLEPYAKHGVGWDLEHCAVTQVIHITRHDGWEQQSATISIDGTITASSECVRSVVEAFWSETL